MVIKKNSKKSKKEQPEEQIVSEIDEGSNGEVLELKAMMAQLMQNVEYNLQNMQEHIADIEETSKKSSDAHLRMVELLYDTPDKRLPELTNLHVLAVKPHSIGMGLERLFDRGILVGTESFTANVRKYVFQLNRSINGMHHKKAGELAEQQTQAQAEQDSMGEDFGGS